MALTERVEQRLRRLQIGRIEPLGEPAVDRREELVGFAAAATVKPQAGEARGRRQFPSFGLLSACYGDILA